MIQLSEHEKITFNACASVEMVKEIEKYYCLPKEKAIEILYDFENIHGINAVIALWGWLLKCQHNKMPDKIKWITISIDLNNKEKGTKLLTAPFFEIAQDHFYYSFIYTL